MELLIKNEQGKQEFNYEAFESVVKNDELKNEIKRIFFHRNERIREIKAFEYEFNDKSLTIQCYVGGILYKIYYWVDSNLYSMASFSSVDAMSLLINGGYTISKDGLVY